MSDENNKNKQNIEQEHNRKFVGLKPNLQSDESIQIRNLFQDWNYPSTTAKLQNNTIYKFDIK